MLALYKDLHHLLHAIEEIVFSQQHLRDAIAPLFKSVVAPCSTGGSGRLRHRPGLVYSHTSVPQPHWLNQTIDLEMPDRCGAATGFTPQHRMTQWQPQKNLPNLPSALQMRLCAAYFMAGNILAASQICAASFDLKNCKSSMAASRCSGFVDTQPVISTGVAASGGRAPTTSRPGGGLR
jgi:hypothetical protein